MSENSLWNNHPIEVLTWIVSVAINPFCVQHSIRKWVPLREKKGRICKRLSPLIIGQSRAKLACLRRCRALFLWKLGACKRSWGTDAMRARELLAISLSDSDRETIQSRALLGTFYALASWVKRLCNNWWWTVWWIMNTVLGDSLIMNVPR